LPSVPATTSVLTRSDLPVEVDGKQIVLNADLIERLEARPETIITLVDGTTYLVAESLQEVVNRVRIFKASVLVTCTGLESPSQQQVALRLVPRRP
jgi:flagellar protein FlbD